MADWKKPELTDNYADVLDEIKERDDDCRTFFMGTVSDVTFIDGGSGLNDLKVYGWPNGNYDFVIEIDSAGSTDTYKWSKDGGSTWEATGITLPVHDEVQELGTTGIKIVWDNISGHTVGDRWEFTTSIPENLPNRTIVFDFSSRTWYWYNSTDGNYYPLTADEPMILPPNYNMIVKGATYLHSSTGIDYYPGHDEYDIPINDGTLNRNLNADMLDGKHASDFVQTSGGDINGNLNVYGMLYSNNGIRGKRYEYIIVVNNGGSGNVTLDFNVHAFAIVTLAGDVTFSFNSPSYSQICHLILKQDSTGGHTVTWPSNVKWADGEAPSVTTSPNAVDVFTFIYDEIDDIFYGIYGLDFK